jgi:hypothetical protein
MAEPQLLDQYRERLDCSRCSFSRYPRPSSGICQARYGRGAAHDIMRLLREEIR